MKQIRCKKTGEIAYCCTCSNGQLEGQILVFRKPSDNLHFFKVYKTWKALWKSWEFIKDNI